MAAKKKSTGKKPVSDVASRRYKTDEYLLNPFNPSDVRQVTRYDRLTGGTSTQFNIKNVHKGGKPTGVRNKWTEPRTTYKDKKTASNVKGNTRKSVSPKRKSK